MISVKQKSKGELKDAKGKAAPAPKRGMANKKTKKAKAKKTRKKGEDDDEE